MLHVHKSSLNKRPSKHISIVWWHTGLGLDFQSCFEGLNIQTAQCRFKRCWDFFIVLGNAKCNCVINNYYKWFKQIICRCKQKVEGCLYPYNKWQSVPTFLQLIRKYVLSEQFTPYTTWPKKHFRQTMPKVTRLALITFPHIQDYEAPKSFTCRSTFI